MTAPALAAKAGQHRLASVVRRPYSSGCCGAMYARLVQTADHRLGQAASTATLAGGAASRGEADAAQTMALCLQMTLAA
jgi:hypothetical protein